MKLAGAYINDEAYGRLAALAAANNRTLAGQCRHLFDRALKGDLEVPDGPVARAARAAAAHSLPGAGAGVKVRAAQAVVPGEPPMGKPSSNILPPVLTPSGMPPSGTPSESASPTPQALCQARAGRCGVRKGSGSGAGDCAPGAVIFQPDTTAMHTPTMNTQPSGGASPRAPRRNPR